MANVTNPAEYPEVIDRDVANPTRVSINPIATSPAPFVADLGDESGEGEQGTPIDAALFEGVRAYVDAGDAAARDEATEAAAADATSKADQAEADAIAEAKRLDGEQTTRLTQAYEDADDAKAAEVTEAYRQADEALQKAIDDLSEAGAVAIQPSTIDAIAGGTPASELSDLGFVERFGVQELQSKLREWVQAEARIQVSQLLGQVALSNGGLAVDLDPEQDPGALATAQESAREAIGAASQDAVSRDRLKIEFVYFEKATIAAQNSRDFLVTLPTYEGYEFNAIEGITSANYSSALVGYYYRSQDNQVIANFVNWTTTAREATPWVRVSYRPV